MTSNKAQETREMQRDMQAALDQMQVSSDNKETIKTPVMSFSNGNVYIGLKLVSTYDKEKNIRREPVPRITAIFNGHFAEFPMNGEWWRSFADFADKMAQAMEGVDITNSNISDDVVTAKNLMARFRKKA